MADDLFKPDPSELPPVTEVPFEELVGDGKKYKDNTAVAHALQEKDRFIAQVLREQKELRESLSKRINEQEFLDRLEQFANKSPDAGNQPPADGTPVAAGLKIEDVEKIISERDAAKTRQDNLNSVTARLVETYGDDFKRHVQTQAQNLGVGTDFLTDIASKNPSAFYRLMGLDQTQKPVENFTPPKTSVNFTPGNATRTEVKNYAYYQKLRKDQGEQAYFTPRVQMEMWNSLKEIGEDKFYA